MKQVIFVSGGEVFETRDDFRKWLTGPESDFMLPQPGVEPVTFWSRNLQEDLGEGYEVLSVSMPLKQHAHYDEWKIWFEKHIQFMYDKVIFVGWSLGANFLYKYLSENNFAREVSSLHLVAGCFGCEGGFDIEHKTLKADYPAFIYHSEDDMIVSYNDALLYKDAIENVTLITYQEHGHFLVEHIPELIQNIKNR